MQLKKQKPSLILTDIYRITILSAIITGFVTHGFALVNPIHNPDDMYNQPTGVGAGTTSGRWFLSILGSFFESFGGTYNLPWLNGLLFLAFLAVASCLLVSTLEITHKFSATLIGAVMVVFPSVTSTMYYRFTSPYYGIAILLAVLAAWIYGRCRFSWLISAICTALSLGIYQAYTPITIAIFVLCLIRKALSNNADFFRIIRTGLCYCGTLILGVLIYAVCLKLMLTLSGSQLTDYKDINQMGSTLDPSLLPWLVMAAFTNFFQLTKADFYGLSFNPVTQKLYLFLIIISLAIVVYIQVRSVKKIGVGLLAILLCLTFPVAANFIIVMSPYYLYTLMMHGLVIIPCFPLVAWECLHSQTHLSDSIKCWVGRGIAIALSIIIALYAYETNIGYTSMYFSRHQTENYFNSLVTQVRMTEGFTADKKWAFLGKINDPLLDNPWTSETRIGGSHATEELLRSYTRMSWIENYIGYKVPLQDEEIIKSLILDEDVKNMPCWPDAGSIRVIDDTVVIKCEELTE